MKVRKTLLGAAFICAMLLGVANAEANDFSIHFKDATVDGGGPTLSPGLNHVNDAVPVDPAAVVTIAGTNQDGAIDITASGIVFNQEVRAVNTTGGYFTVNWRATTPFSGTFDSATGKLEISGSLEQTITQGDNVCVTGPLPLKLSTEGSTVMNTGQRFVAGLGGTGRLVGQWLAYPKPVPGGANCHTDALTCRAQQPLASYSGEVALSVERGLDRVGPASWDACDPPRVLGKPDDISISLSQPLLPFPPAGDVSYEIKAAAGADGASFTIGLGVPRWPDKRVNGSPLAFGEPVVIGVKSIDPLPAPPIVPSYFDCLNGGGGYGTGYKIEMAPTSDATVTLPVSLAAAPWTTDALKPRISISDFYGSTDLDAPAITPTGRIGPWVKVWTKGQKQAIKSIAVNHPFTLVGHVYSNGKLDRRKVRLWTEPDGGETYPLGMARLGAKGNFVKKVKGLPDGRYRVNAKLVGSKSGPSCGNTVRVAP